MYASTVIETHEDRELSADVPATARARWRAFYWLGGMLVAGLLVRCLLLWRFDGLGLSVYDERDYDAIAVNLAQHGEFALTTGEPTSLRPPLYPALVAGMYRVFGVQNYTAVRAVNVFLSLLNVGVVYLLARNIYNQRVGLVAATLFCFYPSLLGAGNLVLTESLFTLLLCTFVLFVERYLSGNSLLWLVAAGVSLGLAALTRSVLWLFPPVLIVFLLCCDWKRAFRYRMLAAATVLVAFCVTLAPWTIRNTRLQKTFTTVDVMGGRNFMMGNYEHTPAYRPWAAIQMTGDDAWYSVLGKRHGGLSGKTQGQIDKLAMRYAIDFILANPWLSIERTTAKFFHFWQLERELLAGAQKGFWGKTGKPLLVLLAVAILGAYVFVMSSGIFGAVVEPPAERAKHLFLLLLVAFVCGIHCLAFAHSRYHLPIMPLIMIYAAACCVRWREIPARWKSWSFAAASLICVTLMASWLWDLASEFHRL